MKMEAKEREEKKGNKGLDRPPEISSSLVIWQRRIGGACGNSMWPSPDGENGGTSIGIRCRDGIVLAVEKVIASGGVLVAGSLLGSSSSLRFFFSSFCG